MLHHYNLTTIKQDLIGLLIKTFFSCKISFSQWKSTFLKQNLQFEMQTKKIMAFEKIFACFFHPKEKNMLKLF